MTLEQALEYIEEDELVEVTPQKLHPAAQGFR
jgi:predicted membrane GTPase involved in stress response